MIGCAYSEICEAVASQGDEKLSEMVKAVPDKDELLLDAAYALDERVIAAALAAGAEPNTRSKSIGGQGFETPLHRAVRGHGDGSFGHVAKLLIDAGADTRALNAAKDTPLHSAVYEGEQRALILVRLGADPAVLDDASQPMFIKSMLLNMMELAQLLLDRGVPVDVRDDRGQTALMVATRDGRLAAVRFLLAHGADPNAPDDKRMTPKRVAMESEDNQLIAIFSPPTAAAVHTSSKRPGCAPSAAVLVLMIAALVPILASHL